MRCYTFPMTRRLAISTIAGLFALLGLTACGSAVSGPSTPRPPTLTERAEKANHPENIRDTIRGASPADETYDLPRSLQDEGTVIVLWYGKTYYSTNESAAVVYKENDGRLIPVRSCPLYAEDIYEAGEDENDSYWGDAEDVWGSDDDIWGDSADMWDTGNSTWERRPISESIDSLTTRIHCETEEEARRAGHRRPMLLVYGTSSGFLGMGEGDETVRGFGYK